MRIKAIINLLNGYEALYKWGDASTKNAVWNNALDLLETHALKTQHNYAGLCAEFNAVLDEIYSNQSPAYLQVWIDELLHDLQTRIEL